MGCIDFEDVLDYNPRCDMFIHHCKYNSSLVIKEQYYGKQNYDKQNLDN